MGAKKQKNKKMEIIERNRKKEPKQINPHSKNEDAI